MITDKNKFTESDYAMLESNKIVAEGFAQYLGQGCEVVLHSLEDLNNSVIKIINGFHSGRNIGHPITDLALQMLDNIEESEESKSIIYMNNSSTKGPIKASTIPIVNQNSKIIGLICINYYLNTPLSFLIDSFVDKDKESSTVTENFNEDIDELIFETVQNVKNQVLSDANISTINKNKEIIKILDKKGIFKLKEAIIKVSKQLAISKNTIYLHLRNKHEHD